VVFADVTVDRTGKVVDVVVKTAPTPAAGQAWADAVRKWSFQPGTYQGKPVDVVYTLSLGMGN
jgi:TonB family protein